MSDLDKELEDFDIDLDKDDVSDDENRALASKRTFKKSAEEDEVTV
jgi:hypothetical protein